MGFLRKSIAKFQINTDEERHLVKDVRDLWLADRPEVHEQACHDADPLEDRHERLQSFCTVHNVHHEMKSRHSTAKFHVRRSAASSQDLFTFRPFASSSTGRILEFSGRVSL